MKRMVFGESVQGASHKRVDKECQDSFKKLEYDDGTVIMAIADGHGSKACPYSMRLEKTGHDRWLTTWAFPIKESSAKREGYDKVQVKGDISFADDYPGCPYCGGHGLTLCSCGHLSCTILRNNIFTCEWCGTQGQIGDYSGETITAGTDY